MSFEIMHLYASDAQMSLKNYTGRVLNCFSKDVGFLGDELPLQLFLYLMVSQAALV